jgi:hypothetical protein
MTARYANPVYPSYFADPFAWKHGGRYYAIGTGPKVLWTRNEYRQGRRWKMAQHADPRRPGCSKR